MVAGGTEAAITPTGFGGFAALTALTSSTDPERCSIPFDKERSGFVMGEGAGVVVLEDWSMPKHVERKSLARLSDMVQQEMLITLHPLQRTVPVLPKLWNGL